MRVQKAQQYCCRRRCLPSQTKPPPAVHHPALCASCWIALWPQQCIYLPFAVDVDAYHRRPNLHLPYTILRCVRCWIALWPQQCIYLPSLSAFKVVAKLYQNQATPRMPSVFHRWLKALPCAPRGHIFLPRMLGQQGGKLDTNSPEEGTVSTRRHASLFRSSLLTSGGGLLVLLAAAAVSYTHLTLPTIYSV